MTSGRSRSRGGIYAAAAAIAITAGLGAVGAAGADQQADTTVYMSEDGSWCFTTDPGRSCAGPHAPADVTIEVGDTVTWNFPPDAGLQPHNARSVSSNWSFTTGTPTNPHTPNPPSYTFTQGGDYTFVCQLHGNMSGTIHVQGGTPTPSPSPSPSPTPSTQPGTNHPTTPPPSGDTTDSVKPSLGGVRLTASVGAVKVRFRLSEPATVTVRVKRKGSRKVLKSARVQASAGTRTVTLRSKRLKKGRYTVEIQARDASGNRSSLAKKQLALRG